MRQRPIAFVLFFCLSLIFSNASAQPLEYQLSKDQVVAYRVTVTATLPSSVETLKGLIAFTGKGTDNANQIVEYRGGLTKSTKSTVARTMPMRGGFRGRPGGGPPRGPFDQPNFRGLTQSTSTLVISSKGDIVSMRGDSQLPYLLGNLALMPFEQLPAEGESEWGDGTSLTITSKEESSRFGPRFGPFAQGNEEETTTGGGEKSEYRIQTDDGKLVSILKTYSLNSPAATSKDTGFEMSGSGTWVFNRELGMSESMDFKVDMTVESGNSSTKIPLTIEWNRIPEQEYKDFLKEREELRAAAIAKAKEPAYPVKISESNKKRILSRLNHSQWGVVWGELQSLSRSRMTGLVAEDMDLMVVVGGLRSNSNDKVKAAAEVIWKKWGASFEELASEEQKAAAAGAAEESNPFIVVTADDMSGPRQWSDKSGRFKIEAEFVALEGTTVVLKGKDGKQIKVDKARLSPDDQAVIERLAK
ncbi:SHD1 domain-containing protein [Aporhodopirellula aestuarii]|uniref:SHD1 domain-containing protein n=1 Tax=Aporhodopirellula aestuarii TaxID=2950107 RepID=A0ABT0U245_9BACT|nr:SHD1 domain-containing protein [Aporhodopirellula aestuarii]MCM2370966.1 SHD1 domain-containing protein [Aporhodopirellula aestuarii]